MSTLPVVLIWIAPTAVLALISIAFFVNRKFLHEMARRRLNAYVFDSGSRSALEARLHTLGRNLDGDHLVPPFVELAKYAREFRPDWVMGVHVGGRLLSVALCDVLKMPANRCLFASTHRSRLEGKTNNNSPFIIEGDGGRDVEAIEGRMLIIDDISRSGATLRDLNNFLHRENYRDSLKLSEVAFAVLVLAVEKNKPRKFTPHWAYFRTPEHYFKLPWTETSLEVATAYDRRDSNRQMEDRGMAHLVVADVNSQAIDEHERQVKDFAHALEVARRDLPLAKIKKAFEAFEAAQAEKKKSG